MRSRGGGWALDPEAIVRRHVEQFLRMERLAGEVEEVVGRDVIVRLDAVRITVRHRQLSGWDAPAPGPGFTWLEIMLEHELRKAGLGDEIMLRLSVDPVAPFLRVSQRVAAIARVVGELAVHLLSRTAPGTALEVPGEELGPLMGSGPSLIRVERHLRSRAGPRAQVVPSLWSRAAPSALATLREENDVLQLHPARFPGIAESWLLLVTGEIWGLSSDALLAPLQPAWRGPGRALILDLVRGECWRVGGGRVPAWPRQSPAVNCGGPEPASSDRAGLEPACSEAMEQRLDARRPQVPGTAVAPRSSACGKTG